MNFGGVEPTSADEPRPVFDHLIRLTDDRGLFEHTDHAQPRREHGYCVDDVARALIVVCREPTPDRAVRRLERHYLSFTLNAIAADGRCHNRMDTSGHWSDEPDVGDWWGRALWGLGVAAANAHSAGARESALTGFRTAAQQRSPNVRSMAFAALGAAEVLRAHPGEPSARSLERDCARVLMAVRDDAPHAVPAEEVVGRGAGAGQAGTTGRGQARATGTARWRWPEARLAYGNGTVAEALIVAGVTLDDGDALARGLDWLDFLLQAETGDGHLSVTPVAGRGPDDAGPGFDQQPIEVASLADACASAFTATGDVHWLSGVHLAWRWFLGDNDSATPMFDPVTGGGYDGLLADGRNLNQGAESTLAMLSTAQHARRFNRVLSAPDKH